jgi:hypothetical protein
MKKKTIPFLLLTTGILFSSVPQITHAYSGINNSSNALGGMRPQYGTITWKRHTSTSQIPNWDLLSSQVGQSAQKKSECEQSNWVVTAMDPSGSIYQTNVSGSANWLHGMPFVNGTPGNWDAALPAMQADGGNNVIVCSFGLDGGGKRIPEPKIPPDECKPEDQRPEHKVEYEDREVANIPYAVYTKLNEVIPKDLRQKVQGENLVKWKETHHAQDSDIVYTNAGEFLQRTKSELVSIMREPNKERSLSRWQDYKQRLQAEIDKDENDATAKSPEIQLDDKNKEGLALGGAFTVTESRNKQKIKYNIQRHYNRTWGCVHVNGSWKWATVNNSSADGWLNAVENGWRVHREDIGVNVQDQSSSRNLTKEAAKDWEVWRSWQFLNVRCNKDELEAIIRSLGGRGDNSVTSKEGSGTVYTPVVKNRVATFFGDPNSSDPALRKTAEEKFYSDTSSCEIPPGDGGKLLCEANPGHDSSNDNHNNIQNRGTSLTNSFGAQTLERDNLSKVKESSNIFTFFRDNISNPFRVDVWHPTGSNNKDFDISDNLTAEFTQFIFSPDGTPTDTKFNFEDKNKNKILNGSELNKKVTIKGQENRFHARGSWSSDKGHPHKGNIRYGYNVKVINNYPSVFSGKGPNAGANRQYTSLLPTYCEVVFNSTEKHAPKVDNRFNAKLSDKEMNYDGKDPNKDLTLNFNRSGEE